MAIARDVWQIAEILDSEGFGSLAGELLAEISAGRPVEKPLQGFKDIVDGARADTEIVWLPIDEKDQLEAALRFLRFRLVDPIIKFSEAERIAGEITDNPGLRLRFIDPDNGLEIGPISTRGPGDDVIARELDQFFSRLPTLLQPPSVKGN